MTQAQVQALINQIVPNGNYTADEMRALLTELNDNASPISIGAWTPTATTPTQSATVTMGEFMYQLANGFVTFSGRYTVALGVGVFDTTFYIDLPTAIQPTANWANATSVNVALTRINGGLTGGCSITSDTGSKLLQVVTADVSDQVTFNFTLVGTFKIS